jgi:hypothetical protein
MEKNSSKLPAGGMTLSSTGTRCRELALLRIVACVTKLLGSHFGG